MQRLVLSIVLLVLAVLSLVAPSVAQTTVYFTYYTPTTLATYPIVCGTGSLSCTLVSGTTANYTCSSVVSGTHYLYPSATLPTISTTFQTTLPTTCRTYTSNNLLPISSAGLNLQYGQTCLNLYYSGGQVRVSPEARTGVVNFTYSTSQSGVASCPATVAATSSGSATVGFLYTITNQTTGTVVCGAGNLQCTSYGSNEYVCPTLVNGQQWAYTNSTNSLSSQTLTSEVECGSFGDGTLPLNYEGISFGLSSGSSQGCTSIYQSPGYATPAISYNVITGTNSFTYQSSSYSSLSSACQSYIPVSLSSSSARYSSSLLTVFALLFVTVLAHSFLLA